MELEKYYGLLVFNKTYDYSYILWLVYQTTTINSILVYRVIQKSLPIG